MARWFVEYRPCVSPDPHDPEVERELPCFRIAPEGEPDHWIAQTNPDLPPKVQEEAAFLIAEALSQLLGI